MSTLPPLSASARRAFLIALASIALSVAGCGKGTHAASDGAPPAGDASTGAPGPSGDDAGAQPGDGGGPEDGGVSDAKPDGPKGPFSCADDKTFPSPIAVPEASSSSEVELTSGVRELLVISDSGNAGAAVAISLATGAVRSLTLPLDATASDDLEGSAWYAGRLYTLTSSGAARRYAPDGAGGLVRDQDAYRIGASPAACADLTAVNCGRNYEGLCLRAPSSAASHACVGYAASKSEAKLYCLTMDATGHLVASTTEAPIPLALGVDQLSDCAFGTAGGPAEDALVVTTNVFNLSHSYRVDEKTGALASLPVATLLTLSGGSNESIALDSKGALYVFADDNKPANPSVAAKSTCINW